MRERYKWTDERLAYLMANYLDKTLSELAYDLDCEESTIYNKANRLGLRKPVKPKVPIRGVPLKNGKFRAYDPCLGPDRFPRVLKYFMSYDEAKAFVDEKKPTLDLGLKLDIVKRRAQMYGVWLDKDADFIQKCKD